MSKTLEETIDGTRYTFTMMAPREASKIAIKLAKVLGPTAGIAVTKSIGDHKEKGKSLDDNISEAVILSTGLTAFCQSLDEKDAELLIDKALYCVTGEGVGDVTADGEHFQGRVFTMWKVVAKSLEHNFSDFFSALGGIKEKITGLVKESFPQTQTGTPGDQSSPE